MRLEIDATLPATPPVDADQADEHQGSAVLNEAKSALNQGIKAAQAGDRSGARNLLLRATALDPNNENAWLWLASISEYPEELLGFLNNVLEINPKNERATEWKTATHALLSKTFVQRGVDASQEGQEDFANECFQKALEYDDRNAAAWIWLASLSDSNTEKIRLLEMALALDPDNQSAKSALENTKANILKDRLTTAKGAAVAGDHAEALRQLDDLLSIEPSCVDAWTMRSHLVEGFDEKIYCFEQILAIEPENVAAKASRDSLLAVFGTAEAANATASDPTSQSEQAEESPSVLFDSDRSREEVNDYEQTYSHQEPTDPMPTEASEHVESGVEAEPSVELDSLPADYSEYSPADDEVVVEQPAAYEDSRTETVAFSYSEFAPDAPETVADGDWNSEVSAPEIPMPGMALPSPVVESAPPTFVEIPASEPTVADTVIEAAPEVEVEVAAFTCPFCSETTDPQAISCSNCFAVLTLSDLELLLGNHNADKPMLRQAVEDMERRRLSSDLSADELVTLGLGHLNLRNFQLGYSCLSDASRLAPNNVVLAGQVNALLIRLDEIRQQEEVQMRMPKGKSILVVDDSPTVRKLISGKLEKSGHTVICANDGVEAMERLEHFVPDLVLLDISMPRMDGYQVCKLIRSNEATKDVTVVMISGKDGFFDKVRGRMAGTTGYITKPFGPETLMKAVEMYLSGEVPEPEDV